MKIAIASSGKDETSEVSITAGRAPYFLIYEGDKLVESIKNPFAVGGGGAGFAVAKMLKDKGVDLVVAGKFGGNMIGAMEEKNMKYKEIIGMNIKQALEACNK